MQPLPMTPPVGNGFLHGKKIALAVLILGGLFIALIAYSLVTKDLAPSPLPQAPLPQESAIPPPGSIPGPSYKREVYAGKDRTSSSTSPIPRATVVSPQSQPSLPKEDAPPMVKEAQANEQAQAGTSSLQEKKSLLPPLTTQGAKPPPKEKPSPSKYLFASPDAVATSPFASTVSPPGSPGIPNALPPDAQSAQASLLKDANVEIPDDPSRVWYMSQALEGITTTDVVSSIPGRIIIRTTRDLTDKGLTGSVLIPQHSLVVVSQAPTQGTDPSRLNIQIKQIELPNGGFLPFSGSVADQYGATGLAGSVNYHLLRNFSGAVLNAVLAIGTRVPTGNQEGFAQTIGQQTTGQISQDIARSGSQIIQQQFITSPTTTVDALYHVKIYPENNVSFAKPAKVVK